jgi:H+/Cl- antiporter ClcA
MSTETTPKKKKGMPRGMYIGSAWIGFAFLSLACWLLSVAQSRQYIEQGLGNSSNFQFILLMIAVFGFALPMLYGIRTVRRAGKEVQQDELQKRMEQK